jgi:hypothetical protein
MPGPAVLAATAAAWLAESVLVLVVARAAGLPLTPGEAVLVGGAAVLAQVAAVTPAGIGTYEAGAVAAVVLLGHDAGIGLAAAVAAHAVSTAYALVLGTVAVVRPAPSLLGRLRLPAAVPARQGAPAGTARLADATSSGPPAPVVLFLPAHDEAASVGAVVRRVPPTVLGHPTVTLVVDDGSRDGTADVAAAAGAVVVRHATNRGLGAAVRTGFAAAADFQPAAVAFCDADGEYAPEELALLVGPILAGSADYVVGSRFAGQIERMRPHRRVGNLVLTRVLALVARRPITDGQSGYRACSPAAAAAADLVHDYNYAQVLTLDLLAKGFRYAEVPIRYSFRERGTSFVRLGRYLRAVGPAVYRELNTA